MEIESGTVSGLNRQIVVWSLAAVGASVLLVSVLVSQNQRNQIRWSTFVAGNPETGERLFYEKKGCAVCHSVNGKGGKLASDLGRTLPAHASLGDLVVSVWNHAPQMCERLKSENVSHPAVDDDDMAHLLAFLYQARYFDVQGDVERGRQLFEAKGCGRCHTPEGFHAVANPVSWAREMWNHAAVMQSRMQAAGMAWSRFEGTEMSDLFAYVSRDARNRASGPVSASAGRGWKVFLDNACARCHSVSGKGGHSGPELGPGARIPQDMTQFAGMMWNHAPMWNRPEAANIRRPSFTGQEIADLGTFLHSLEYHESSGSPHIGQSIFAERGCGRCHGADARGAPDGPALRARGKAFNSVSLAATLWQHGSGMYRRTREMGLDWPTLSANDVGHLVSFLSAAP